jgi:hypothetical protein
MFIVLRYLQKYENFHIKIISNYNLLKYKYMYDIR